MSWTGEWVCILWHVCGEVTDLGGMQWCRWTWAVARGRCMGIRVRLMTDEGTRWFESTWRKWTNYEGLFLFTAKVGVRWPMGWDSPNRDKYYREWQVERLWRETRTSWPSLMSRKCSANRSVNLNRKLKEWLIFSYFYGTSGSLFIKYVVKQLLILFLCYIYFKNKNMEKKCEDVWCITWNEKKKWNQEN